MRFWCHDPALTLAVVDERVNTLQQHKRPGHDAAIFPNNAQGRDGCPVGYLAQLCLWLYPATPKLPSMASWGKGMGGESHSLFRACQVIHKSKKNKESTWAEKLSFEEACVLGSIRI